MYVYTVMQDYESERPEGTFTSVEAAKSFAEQLASEAYDRETFIFDWTTGKNDTSVIAAWGDYRYGSFTIYRTLLQGA